MPRHPAGGNRPLRHCFYSILYVRLTDKTFVRYDEDGVHTIFRDAGLWERDGYLVRERQMLIDQQEFFIMSVFPEQPAATPTDKMLELIDAELKKEAHR